MNKAQVLFYEQQRFTQLWLWVLLLGICAVSWWAFGQQIILKQPFGEHPAPDWGLYVILALVGFGLPVLFLFCRLVTEVRTDALYVRFVPFHLRPVRIEYTTITSCLAVNYSPLRDYGGWGVRYSRSGKAYNVSGNLGVRLEFTTGAPLLIGSAHPVELAAAIQQAMGAMVGSGGPRAAGR